MTAGRKPRGVPRVGRADAGRLLDGQPPHARHDALSAVLAAAAAPARESELTGLEPVLAAFAGSSASETDVTPVPVRRLGAGGLRARLTRGVPLKAAVLAAAVVTGVFGAAETGALPTSVQHLAHAALGALGVPAPSGVPTAPRTAGSAPGRPAASPGPMTPGAGTGVQASATSDTDLVSLCAIVSADGDKWRSVLDAAGRRALAAAAGSESRVPDYCAARGSAGTPTPTLTPAPGPAPAASASPGASAVQHGKSPHTPKAR